MGSPTIRRQLQIYISAENVNGRTLTEETLYLITGNVLYVKCSNTLMLQCCMLTGNEHIQRQKQIVFWVVFIGVLGLVK